MKNYKTKLQITKIFQTLNKKGYITTNEALFRYSPPIKRLAAVMHKIKKILIKRGDRQYIYTDTMNDNTAKYILRNGKSKNNKKR